MSAPRKRVGAVSPMRRLRAERISRGLSVADLAQLSGYSASHISSVEYGRFTLTNRLAYSIATAYGLEGEEVSWWSGQWARLVVEVLP